MQRHQGHEWMRQQDVTAPDLVEGTPRAGLDVETNSPSPLFSDEFLVAKKLMPTTLGPGDFGLRFASTPVLAPFPYPLRSHGC